MYSAACVDATWMPLTETALGPPPPVLRGSSSTMRGGAVGPFSSCVRHAARGARKGEDGAIYGGVEGAQETSDG